VRSKGNAAAGLAIDLHIATGALNQAVDQKQPYPCAFSRFGMKMSKYVKQLLAPPNQVDAQVIVSHLKQGGCALLEVRTCTRSGQVGWRYLKALLSRLNRIVCRLLRTPCRVGRAAKSAVSWPCVANQAGHKVSCTSASTSARATGS
jgi:hypothetical protein